jgi:anaerobic magnesium-protoporphyrin IX monomethyl ester cyclase
VRVLLIHTNRERAPQPVIPLGLCLVACALEARGFQPRLLDLCFSRRPLRDVARAIAKWQPDAIGLSIRNLDNGEYLSPRSYLPEVVEVARMCRECSAAPLVIGGPAVSIAPAKMLAALGADYAIVGEGEAAMPELLERIRNGQSTSDIPGVCQDGAALPAPARVPDLDRLALAAPGRWLDIARYLRWGSPVPVQSKRGCALDCIHCTYRSIEGAEYRLRSPEAVVEEMADAAGRWGVRRFEFVDSTFNHPSQHAVALCEAMARTPLRADLHTMGLNPAGASQHLLKLMKQAGFTSVLCTPDSGSDQMLETLRKGFDADQVARTATWAREAGLALLWSFLFGGPGENERTVRETLGLIETALGAQDRILCTVGLRVYPNTELARIALDEGAVSRDADLTTPVFYCSPHIAPRRILELVDGCARRSQMLYLQTLQRPAIAWALRAQAAFRLPGPMWRGVPLYNRLAAWARPLRRCR